MPKIIFVTVSLFVSVGLLTGAVIDKNKGSGTALPGNSSGISKDVSKPKRKRIKLIQGTAAVAERTSAIQHDRAEHGKPGADIVNVNSESYFLDVHEQKNIELKLRVEQTGGAVDVHVETDDGLRLVGAKADWQYTIDHVQTLELPVTIYGATEGRHYVHIFATFTDQYGRKSSRALAQQIDVGVSSVEVNRYKSASTTDGNPYVKMPARETIY